MGAAKPPRAATELAVGKGSVKTGRVVLQIGVRNVGYVTGIGMHISQCREGAYIG